MRDWSRLHNGLLIVVALLLILNGSADADGLALDSPEVDQQLEGRTAVFLALDMQSGQHYLLNAARLDQRQRPFSTFKIPNLMIALETGVEQSLSSEREWDAERFPKGDYWPEEWAQAQTLESAFRRSAVWYFRAIAEEVGGNRYREWLGRLKYGNGAAPDENNQFWLTGPLEISVREQLAFLRQLLEGDFDIQPSTIQALRQASLLEQKQGYRLHGKTGAGPATDDFDGPFEGWLVGWIERPDQAPAVFVLYVEGSSFARIRLFRRDLTEVLLTEAGLWPRD